MGGEGGGTSVCTPPPSSLTLHPFPPQTSTSDNAIPNQDQPPIAHPRDKCPESRLSSTSTVHTAVVRRSELYNPMAQCLVVHSVRRDAMLGCGRQ